MLSMAAGKRERYRAKLLGEFYNGLGRLVKRALLPIESDE